MVKLELEFGDLARSSDPILKRVIAALQWWVTIHTSVAYRLYDALAADGYVQPRLAIFQ